MLEVYFYCIHALYLEFRRADGLAYTAQQQRSQQQKQWIANLRSPYHQSQKIKSYPWYSLILLIFC